MSTITRAGQLNVGQTERTISAIGGALLALIALWRAPWALILAALAALLLFRGRTGRCPIYRYLGISSADAPSEAPRQPSEETVDETIDESFPASDPPGWHSGSSFTQVSE